SAWPGMPTGVASRSPKTVIRGSGGFPSVKSRSPRWWPGLFPCASPREHSGRFSLWVSKARVRLAAADNRTMNEGRGTATGCGWLLAGACRQPWPASLRWEKGKGTGYIILDRRRPVGEKGCHATRRARCLGRLLLPLRNRGHARRTVFHKEGDFAAFAQ